MIELLPALGVLFVSAATPGPNNALMLSLGAIYGFAAVRRLIAGAMIGAAGMFTLSNLGLGSLLLAQPALLNFLRAIGALMLLWIAWKICTAPRPEPGENQPPLAGFAFGFCMQWVNPKLWSVVLAMITLLPPPEAGGQLVWQAAVVAAACSLTTGFCMSMWALFGTLLARLVKTERAHRAVCAASAILMLVFVAAAFAVSA